MLNTSAKCNIIPKKIARELSCAIINTNEFVLFTATGDKFKFAGIAKMQVNIINSVGCNTAFFLAEESAKILID